MSGAEHSPGSPPGGSDAPSSGSDSFLPTRWVWPFPPVQPRTAAFVRRVCDWATPLVIGWRWLPVALAIGGGPLLVSYFSRLPGHQAATALLLYFPFLSSIRQARPGKTLLLIAVTFGAHSVGVIVLASRDPAGISPLVPGAEPFWQESLDWIATGENPEYVPRRWVPQHALLFCLVVGLAYCSLGLTVLLRGLYEVDLMNYYVGRLLAQSSSTSAALIYGWHVWSLVRGVGCALILYEVTAISLSALARTGPRRPGGRLRLAAGIALLVLDGVLKLLLMDTVQARLQANLL